MKTKKKLVDLIYLDSQRLDKDLKKEYRARINTWMDWINTMLDKVVEEEIYVDEQSEYFMANSFLKSFLTKRLDWVLESVDNSELRNKYLLALPPFNQTGNVKQFFLHFFQFKDSPEQKTLEFRYLNKSEREVRILWDINKLIKTMQTISILQKHVSGPKPFISSFTRTDVVNNLSSLKKALTLLVKICIKQEFHDQILGEFPIDCFEPEAILERKESEDYYVNDVVLEKFDYRNYFFHIYFRSNLKAIYKGRDLTFKFNYLDYEIVRQEFLIHWINQRLTNNPRKWEILDNYTMGRKTFSEVIEKTPELEITLLKRLPKNIFDDLMAEVNDSIQNEEDRAPVDPMSEKFGEFSKQFVLFEKAKELAQKSIQAIRKYLGKSDRPEPSWKDMVSKEQNDKNTNESEDSDDTFDTQYNIKILKKKEIDYPHFCEVNSEFSKQISLLQTKMPPDQHTRFQKTVSEYLSKISESAIIKRRTPRHEWAVNYQIQEKWGETENNQLLILGAEVKRKQLSMGYSSGNDEDFEFKTYFVYGSEEILIEMGNPVETRKVRNKTYHIYNFTVPSVINKVMKLVEEVTKN